MSEKSGHPVLERFEKIATYFLMVVLAILVVLGLFQLVLLLIIRVPQEITAINNTTQLQEALQRGFGGVLAVVIGLELMETLKHYARESTVRLEVIIIVAMIAIGRHIVQLDVHHSDPIILFGLAAIALALGASYYLIKRTQTKS